ncbi:hypothetical protein Tco_0051868 [Tanacetum coccineum]
MSEFRQTSQFVEDVSSIPGIVDMYLASKMKEVVDVAVQLQTNKLREETQAENQEFFNQVDSTMKAIIKEQVQAQVSKIMPKIEKCVIESLGAEVLVRSTNQPQTSYAVVASLLEFELKKILIDKMETNKPIDISNTQKNLYNALVESYNTDKDIITSYGDVVTLKRRRNDQDKDEDPSAGSNRGSKRRRSGKSAHAKEHDQKAADLEDQPQQEFNTGNENESLVREALNEDVWHRNPSRPPTPDLFGYSYRLLCLHNAPAQIDNLTQDVLTDPTYDLIKVTCKCVVELKYHLEEVFKVTNDRLDWHNPKGKPYPHDLSKPLPLILNEQGGQVIPLIHFINNDLEYLKGGSSSQKYTTSITKTKAADYGPKCQKFYGYASNIETSKDVYSRHRIIADDQLYIFREGDIKRLCRQDIEDMLLLLVQDKLTNLNLEERYALNVALRMFTRPYPNIQGFIYEDEMNRNRLMRTDELHKFSDGTLNHVQIALNDIALGIEIEYLPKRK